MERSIAASESVLEAVPAVVSKISYSGVRKYAGKVTPGISCRVFNFFKGFLKEYKKPIIIATVAVVTIVKVHSIIRKRKYRKEWNSAGKDVVVVHAFSRTTTCPNLSPFVIKLETYLRMADITYKFDDQYPFGSKGKCPWITLNGRDYTDSQLIIEFLGKEFQKDFSNTLSDEQKAVSRAMQVMADEHILWGLAWWRFIKDRVQTLLIMTKSPIIAQFFFKSYIPKIRKMLWYQGFGRHSEHEKIEIIRKDIEAISNYLGNKKFLHGNAPSEIDCCIFGMLSQCVWGTPGSIFETMVKNDYPNLLQYCNRMKDKFWSDWEQCLLK